MKKILSVILSVIIILSVCSAAASAETEKRDFEYYKSLSNDELAEMLGSAAYHLYDRKVITAQDLKLIASGLDYMQLYKDNLIAERGFMAIGIISEIAKAATNGNTETTLQDEYSFGQGTFVVGADLKAGTYDITCKSTSDDGFDDSMSGFSDFYADQGMDDYADMFSSISGMYDSIAGMTVETIGKDGLMDKYLTLKSGETARIILEDGMKLELSGGSADLVFVR